MAKKTTTPRVPAKQKVPPLIDSPNAKEIFVSEVVGTGIIAGCVSVNLASHRWTVAESGTEPEFTRAMVARLVLTREAATQLAYHLANLAEQAKQAGGAQATGTKPGGNGKPAKK